MSIYRTSLLHMEGCRSNDPRKVSYQQITRRQKFNLKLGKCARQGICVTMIFRQIPLNPYYIIKRLTYEHIDMGVELSLYGT